MFAFNKLVGRIWLLRRRAAARPPVIAPAGGAMRSTYADVRLVSVGLAPMGGPADRDDVRRGGRP